MLNDGDCKSWPEVIKTVQSEIADFYLITVEQMNSKRNWNAVEARKVFVCIGRNFRLTGSGKPLTWEFLANSVSRHSSAVYQGHRTLLRDVSLDDRMRRRVNKIIKRVTKRNKLVKL